jgi:hypothetical protein
VAVRALADEATPENIEPSENFTKAYKSEAIVSHLHRYAELLETGVHLSPWFC